MHAYTSHVPRTAAICIDRAIYSPFELLFEVKARTYRKSDPGYGNGRSRKREQDFICVLDWARDFGDRVEKKKKNIVVVRSLPCFPTSSSRKTKIRSMHKVSSNLCSSYGGGQEMDFMPKRQGPVKLSQSSILWLPEFLALKLFSFVWFWFSRKCRASRPITGGWPTFRWATGSTSRASGGTPSARTPTQTSRTFTLLPRSSLSDIRQVRQPRQVLGYILRVDHLEGLVLIVLTSIQ